MLAAMKSLPENVAPYHRTDLFDETTVPAGLLKDHTTKDGVWGLIQVAAGRLEYVIEADAAANRSAEIHILEPGTDGVVEPTVKHRVRPLGPVKFYVEFLR